MRCAVIVVVFATLVVTRNLASATCAQSVELAPREGPLPANPTVYLFVPKVGDPVIEANVPITTDVVDRSGTYTVHRIKIHATSGVAKLRVFLYWGRVPLTGEYEIGAASTNSSVVTAVRHENPVMACSRTDVIDFKIAGTAVAYRLDWRSPDPPTFLSARSPRLGEICFTSNAEEPAITQLRAFELVALYADGSERALGTSVLMLGRYQVRVPIELVGSTGHIEERWPLVHWSPADEPESNLLGWLGVLAGLGVLALGTRSLATHIGVYSAQQRDLPRARVVRGADSRR
jgi:hypothetical protein